VLTGVMLFLLVIVALLAVPVTLHYRVSWQRAFQGSVNLHWLFGLVRVKLPSPQPKAASSGKRKSVKKKRKKDASRKQSSPAAAIRSKPFRQRVVRFIREIWCAIHKQNLRLRIRIGLGDPADTGQLWALMGPLSGLLANTREATIEIEPEFVDAVFELDSSGSIRVIPLQLLYLVFGLLLSPSIWRGIRRMRQTG
jgi:hypothetical protein